MLNRQSVQSLSIGEIYTRLPQLQAIAKINKATNMLLVKHNMKIMEDDLYRRINEAEERGESC